jgi:hypothetical protein
MHDINNSLRLPQSKVGLSGGSNLTECIPSAEAADGGTPKTLVTSRPILKHKKQADKAEVPQPLTNYVRIDKVSGKLLPKTVCSNVFWKQCLCCSPETSGPNGATNHKVGT